MMRLRHILPILLLALLAGCASRRAIKPVEPVEPVTPVVAAPAWHTCAASARATVTMSRQQLQASMQLQAVYDSMLIVSVQPLPGIEMVRIEATPEQVLIVDKMNKQFATMNYDELSVMAKRPVTWQMLQSLVTAEHEDTMQMSANLAGQPVKIEISQIQANLDVPVRIRATSLAGYKPMILSEQK